MKNESKTALELMRLEGICKLIMDNVEEESLVNRYLRIKEKLMICKKQLGNVQNHNL